MYYGKKSAEARFTRFYLKGARCLANYDVEFGDEIRMRSSRTGNQSRMMDGVVIKYIFRFLGVTSRKRCDIEPDHN